MIFIFQIFHGVWTIAFFVLTLVNTKTVLPNASCLLAGYLPATTVLHILLIPSDYPLPVKYINVSSLTLYVCSVSLTRAKTDKIEHFLLDVCFVTFM